jgi:hypothetical protein
VEKSGGLGRMKITPKQAQELFNQLLIHVKMGRDSLTYWHAEPPHWDKDFYEWWKPEIDLLEEISGKDIDTLILESKDLLN